MARQVSLFRCGVVLVDRSQGGTVPDPQPQRGPLRPHNQTLGMRHRPTSDCGLHDSHRNKNLGHVNVSNAEEEEEEEA